MPILRGWVKKGDPSFDAQKGSNYRFYKNEVSSRPSGDLIDEIHANWLSDYHLLESHHGYIQWLFPLFEGGGMNFHSEALHKEEAKLMRKDVDVAQRIVKSYKIVQSLGHLGFSRYKRPFLEFMEKEIVENKQLRWAKQSLKSYWLPLLDVDSAAFIRKTYETEEDREDSVFFTLPEVPPEVAQYNK